jgi:hypothetical protein
MTVWLSGCGGSHFLVSIPRGDGAVGAEHMPADTDDPTADVLGGDDLNTDTTLLLARR